MKTRVLPAIMLLACTVAAQRPQPAKPLTPNDRPDIQTLSRTVRALRQNAQLSPDNASRADQLLQESTTLLAEGQIGAARSRLAKAQAAISGQPWTNKE